MTGAFVLCSIFIFCFSMNQPQDVEYPVFLEINRPKDDAASRSRTSADQGGNAPQESSEAGDGFPQVRRVTSLPTYVPGWAAHIVPVLLFGLFACGFGAIHCLAWNSPFPTSQEKLAWRICSASTTVLPASAISSTFALIYANDFRISHVGKGSTLILVYMFTYVVGRTAIIVLAFMALRAMPVDAFQTVIWNAYIPHFAA